MIYPNWIYYPDGNLELFIDTVQQVSYVTGCRTTEYVRTRDGSRSSVAAKQLSTATFECTWDTNHIKDLYRYLEYLRGKEVILAFGPLDLASYAKIVEASVPKTTGTVQKATLSVQFLGSVRGQFWEAEDYNYNGSIDTPENSSSMGTAVVVNVPWTGVAKPFTQSDIVLPAGNYTMFARVKDVNQVSNEVLLVVRNNTDSTSIASSTATATALYSTYVCNFTITSSHVGKTIKFFVQKATTTTNNIYVDFFGFVAVP